MILAIGIVLLVLAVVFCWAGYAASETLVFIKERYVPMPNIVWMALFGLSGLSFAVAIPLIATQVLSICR